MKALERGADVFRNTTCTGDTDIVLRINGEYIPIDVKQKAWFFEEKKRKGYWKASGGNNIPKHVYGVAVNPETKGISWYGLPGSHGNRAKFNCPKGLEDFWK